MALTMTDDDEAGHRLVVDTVRLDAVPEFLLEAAEAFAAELDATRAALAQAERERDEARRLAGTMSGLRDQGERAYDEQAAQLAAREAENAEMRAVADEALNVLIGCVVPAGGCDDRQHLLEAQGALRAILSRPPGSDAALRAMLEGCARLTARIAFSASDAGGDYETFAKVDLPLIPARLLPPATQAQGEKEGAEG